MKTSTSILIPLVILSAIAPFIGSAAMQLAFLFTSVMLACTFFVCRVIEALKEGEK